MRYIWNVITWAYLSIGQSSYLNALYLKCYYLSKVDIEFLSIGQCLYWNALYLKCYYPSKADIEYLSIGQCPYWNGFYLKFYYLRKMDIEYLFICQCTDWSAVICQMLLPEQSWHRISVCWSMLLLELDLPDRFPSAITHKPLERNRYIHIYQHQDYLKMSICILIVHYVRYTFRTYFVHIPYNYIK